MSSAASSTTATQKKTKCTLLHWPAEWSPHAACILLYPHNPRTYRLDRVIPAFLAVARAIVEQGNESVLFFCKDGATREQLEAELLLRAENCETWSSSGKGARVFALTCASNDTWARDVAPTFVVEHDLLHRRDDDSKTTKTILVGLDWDFNAYGGEAGGCCYWPCAADQEVAATVCREIMIHRSNLVVVPVEIVVQHRKVPLVLEGGSIHTDGEGTILTTKECLLNPNRNSEMSQAEIEAAVLEATGCTKMIWLDHGLDFDDDTNGHIDNWACFVAPGVVVLAWTDDADDDADIEHVCETNNYERCRAALAVLEAVTDAKGRALTVHKLYLPKPMFYTREIVDSLLRVVGDDKTELDNPRQVGDRMAASYVNFYIANEAVIVPQFGDAEFDPMAMAKLQELFPDRKVVGVPSLEILIGGGNIHCITQQIPKI